MSSIRQRYDAALADLRKAQEVCEAAAAALIADQPNFVAQELARATCHIDMWPAWKRKLARVDG